MDLEDAKRILSAKGWVFASRKGHRAVFMGENDTTLLIDTRMLYKPSYGFWGRFMRSILRKK